MKKIISVLFVAVLMLTIVSCNTKVKEDPTTSPVTTDTTTVVTTDTIK